MTYNQEKVKILSSQGEKNQIEREKNIKLEWPCMRTLRRAFFFNNQRERCSVQRMRIKWRRSAQGRRRAVSQMPPEEMCYITRGEINTCIIRQLHLCPPPMAPFPNTIITISRQPPPVALRLSPNTQTRPLNPRHGPVIIHLITHESQHTSLFFLLRIRKRKIRIQPKERIVTPLLHHHSLHSPPRSPLPSLFCMIQRTKERLQPSFVLVYVGRGVPCVFAMWQEEGERWQGGAWKLERKCCELEVGVVAGEARRGNVRSRFL